MIEAALYYEEASDGLGSDFLDDVQRAIDRVTDYPHVGDQALPQKSEFSLRSAKGAKYDSQGQARSASPLVSRNQLRGALKVRNMMAIISLFQSFTIITLLPRGKREARRPW